MNWLFSETFWGTVLVLWGASVILNAVFHLNIPVFRIILGLIIIYVGLRMLLGWSCRSGRNPGAITSVTGKGAGADRDYSVAFGSTAVDLTKVELQGSETTITVNVSFGEARVKVDPKACVRVEAHSAFGVAVMPNGSSAAFGNTSWESRPRKGNEKVLLVRGHVAFGKLEISAR
jgi:predicted membrane protein